MLIIAAMLPSDPRRPHDLGGALGFGPLERAPNEPLFHHEWEARAFVLNRLLLQAGLYNLDEFRYAIEQMTPAAYAKASYYERWVIAIERLLTDKGVLP